MAIFVRVAEAGSFAAVAEEMQVSRSAVTRHVAALERHLGAKLMTRSTRSLSLTPAGTSYLEKCRAILNLVDAAESGVAEERVVRGRIRVALPISFGLQRLSPMVLGFARSHPQLQLELRFSDVRANLVEEGIDIAFRITRSVQPGDIVRRLGQCRILTVASPAYLAAHGEPKAPQDLAGHECLVYSMVESPLAWQFGPSGRETSVPVRARLVANNGLALTMATAQGMGISRQPDFIVAPFLARKEIVEILQPYEPPPLDVYAVLPSNRYIPRRVSALIDHVAKGLAPQPAA